MNWQVNIDQRLLMSIGELADLLSSDVQSGAPLPPDAIKKHNVSVMRVLEKACLLDRVRILRGNSDALGHFLRNLDTLEVCYAQKRKWRLTNTPSENPHFIILDDYRQTCLRDANKLEVQPAEVVRWMNSVHEGRELLPASLRVYLAESALAASEFEHGWRDFEDKERLRYEADPQGNALPSQPPAAADAGPVKQKKKRVRGEISAKNTAPLFGVSQREIQNWDAGIRTPHGYPGRGNLLALKAFVFEYNSKKTSIRRRPEVHRSRAAAWPMMLLINTPTISGGIATNRIRTVKISHS